MKLEKNEKTLRKRTIDTAIAVGTLAAAGGVLAAGVYESRKSRLDGARAEQNQTATPIGPRALMAKKITN